MKKETAQNFIQNFNLQKKKKISPLIGYKLNGSSIWTILTKNELRNAAPRFVSNKRMESIIHN